MLLTGIHLMRTGVIEANLVRLNEEFRLPYIADLVARKLAGPEKSVLDDADLAFHESEYQRLRGELQATHDASTLPELPSDEAKSDLPIRETLALHHKNPMCASCHLRFDSFGLAFEGYGPVGDARTKDLAGRPIDASATFPGGVEGVGLKGLQTFIQGHRQDNFLDNLSRKLLAYALNRSLQLSDESLVDQMKARLASDDYRFQALVETIVVSPQFLNRRADAPAPPPPRDPQTGKLIVATTERRNAHAAAD